MQKRASFSLFLMISTTLRAVMICHYSVMDKKSRIKMIRLFWCGKRDLNPYGVNHTPLKRARLPVPPLSHAVSNCVAHNVDYYTPFSSICQVLFQNFSKKFFQREKWASNVVVFDLDFFKIFL